MRKAKSLATATLCAALLTVPVAVCQAKPVTVKFWTHIMGMGEWAPIVKAFEKTHPDIKVAVTGADNSKILTALSAGVPPDIMSIAGYDIPNFSMRGLILPLDKYLTMERLGKDDFFFPAWHQLTFSGKVWALPMETNPCYALMWNKDLFAKSGFPESEAPDTIEEMALITSKVMRVDDKGNILTFGFWPPSLTGAMANAVFNWGWIFGGEFYNEAKGVFTVNDPKNVKALSWMTSFSQKYGIDRLRRFGDAYLSGKQAMVTTVPFYMLQGLKPGKAKFRYGITPYQPYPETGGVKGVTWDGGWTMGIPKGSKQAKAGWEFIKWLCASSEGAQAFYDFANMRLTGYRKAALYQKMIADKDIDKATIDILELAKYGRPVSPATYKLMEEMEKAGWDAMNLKRTPQQVLDQAQTVALREQARYVKYTK